MGVKKKIFKGTVCATSIWRVPRNTVDIFCSRHGGTSKMSTTLMSTENLRGGHRVSPWGHRGSPWGSPCISVGVTMDLRVTTGLPSIVDRWSLFYFRVLLKMYHEQCTCTCVCICMCLCVIVCLIMWYKQIVWLGTVNIFKTVNSCKQIMLPGSTGIKMLSRLSIRPFKLIDSCRHRDYHLPEI